MSRKRNKPLPPNVSYRAPQERLLADVTHQSSRITFAEEGAVVVVNLYAEGGTIPSYRAVFPDNTFIAACEAMLERKGWKRPPLSPWPYEE